MMEIANAQPITDANSAVSKNAYLEESNFINDKLYYGFIKEGMFLIYSNFNDRYSEANRIIFDGVTYYRYMDYIYSPKPIQSLTEKEIVELCDLRLKYFSNVVNNKYNYRALICIINEINKHNSGNLRILDFGCGDGYFTKELEKLIPNSIVSGIDLSNKAVSIAKKSGVNASTISISNGKIKYFSGIVNQLDESFDVIVSMFVLHFKIDSAFIAEIARLLKKNGVLIFNFYNTSYSMESLMNNLINADFTITEVNNCSLPTKHKVFLCKKRF